MELIPCVFLIYFYDNSRHVKSIIVENDDHEYRKISMKPIHQYLLQQLVRMVKHEKDLICPALVTYCSTKLSQRHLPSPFERT